MRFTTAHPLHPRSRLGALGTRLLLLAVTGTPLAPAEERAPEAAAAPSGPPLGAANAMTTSDEAASGATQSDTDVTVIDADSAVRAALEHSPSRAAATTQAEQARHQVSAEEARYQFIFEADAGYTQATTPRLQTGDTLSSNTSRSFLVGAQLSRQFALGTSAEFRVEGERYANEFDGGFVNPLLNQASGYGARMRLTLTQPILRGAGRTVGLQNLHTAEASRSQAESSARRVTSALVRDVLVAYGELWYATEARLIEEQSLTLAKAQEKDALDRVRTGSLAPADGYTFSTRVAELEESRVTAAASERARSLELQRLLGSGSRSDRPLRAAAAPGTLAIPSSRELERALETNSVELAELEAAITEARVRAEVAGDSLRPRLDAEGYVESVGLGEDPGSAVSRSGQFGWVTGHVGLTFEAPIGGARKNAERAAARAAVHTAEANLKVTRDRIRAEAEISVTTAQAAEARLLLAERTRKLAERTFEAERNRYQVGSGLALAVQEADESVRRARLREARARVDLFTEQAKLQHVTGGLLVRFGG